LIIIIPSSAAKKADEPPPGDVMSDLLGMLSRRRKAMVGGRADEKPAGRSGASDVKGVEAFIAQGGDDDDDDDDDGDWEDD
jgi:hypothetical protein